MTFLYTKSLTLHKKQDNIRYIFINKTQGTLRYAIFHENFEFGIFLQEACHFALRDVFIYKKPDTSPTARHFALRFYIRKLGHFALLDFSLTFWNWRRGEDIFILKKNALCVEFLYPKDNTLYVILFIQKALRFALHFYTQKTMHFALWFYI